MMPLRCLIIDDKPLAVDVLADYVRKTSFLELAGSTTNPIAGRTPPWPKNGESRCPSM